MRPTPLLLLFAVLTTGLWSCNDQCQETRVVKQMTPVTVSLMEIRRSLKTEAPRALEHPGKIYIKGNYLLINEIKKGLHVIDNSNPAAPRFVSFINIPGNGDMAVRDNILYADSYTDLVALDITDPTQPKEVGRVGEVFKNGQFEGAWWSYNESIGAINDQKVEYRTETISTNCEENPVMPGMWWGIGGAWRMMDVAFSSSAAPASAPGSSDGKGGSMARFALYNQFLYTVGQNNLHLFDISNPAKPASYSTVNIGWGIETIFPYKDKLFIGSSTGMYIYDNSNPSDPKQLSVFQHMMACDPVVVQDNVAYVTLRSGTTCRNAQNQLDLVDISDLSRPRLIKSYPMQNPHGLSINFPTLYLCEGQYGLKTFNVTDQFGVDKNLLSHMKEVDAYDVISLGKTLLMVGKDGFYQFDATNPRQLRQISKIPVGKSAI
ncbi:hypothetical protein [Telluribacter sp.]|jgi:hypothetical protein|uniref:LVIVD repeat-containing protein n=1 Tax=Telluribacter sp. TaxID=1978767 RepID=UPI002E141531|nr:hypothetical protein [Telluribacter sp.]